MPETCQHESEDDDVLRKAWGGEKLAYSKKIGDASDSQRNQERRFAHTAELARAHCEGNEQDDAEPAEFDGRRELHGLPAPLRRSVAARAHSFSQAAVRGALAGARCSSAASRVKSEATSMS